MIVSNFKYDSPILRKKSTVMNLQFIFFKYGEILCSLNIKAAYQQKRKRPEPTAIWIDVSRYVLCG